MPQALPHIMLHVTLVLLILGHSVLAKAHLYSSIQLVKIMYYIHVVVSHAKMFSLVCDKNKTITVPLTYILNKYISFIRQPLNQIK